MWMSVCRCLCPFYSRNRQTFLSYLELFGQVFRKKICFVCLFSSVLGFSFSPPTLLVINMNIILFLAPHLLGK